MFTKDSIRIDVPQRLRSFLVNPTPYFDQTVKEADKEALTTLKTKVQSITHRRSGRLANSIQVDLLNRKVYSKHPAARAYQLGHYAKPKNTPKKMFLHFTDKGKEVFIKSVRTKRQKFFFETLDENRAKVISIYDKAFKRLLEKI